MGEAEVLTAWKYVARVRVCYSPPPKKVMFFHSELLLDNSASFTSSKMKELCQQWKVKLIFRGDWSSLMTWPDWPWPLIGLSYDRSMWRSSGQLLIPTSSQCRDPAVSLLAIYRLNVQHHFLVVDRWRLICHLRSPHNPHVPFSFNVRCV